MNASYVCLSGLWASVADILNRAKPPSAIRLLNDIGQNSEDCRANATAFGKPLEAEENYMLTDFGIHRWPTVQILADYHLLDALADWGEVPCNIPVTEVRSSER